MAEVTEEILLSVKLDRGESEKQVDSLTKSIVELNNANKKLTEDNKALTKSGQENSKAYVDNAKQIEINKQKVSENTASRKGLIQSIVSEDNSIKSLKVRNAELIRQRDQINTSTDEGKKKISLINAEIDKNNKSVKENSSALEKQRLGVGDYSGALDKLVPGLGATASGFGAMAKQALVFIATPIGAVIGALGLAIAALTSYFKGSEEGQTKFNKIMNVGSAIIGKFSDLVQFLGGTLFKNLAKGFEAIIGFLDKWVPGFREATDALSKFLNLDVAAHISALDEERVALNRLLITERGRLQNEIEAAKLRSESTKNIKDRTAALAEVEKLTNELFDKEVRLAKLENQIAVENGKLANNTIEDNDKIAESIAKIDDIERQRSAALKENATKQLAINEQAKAERKKADEEEAEIARNKRLRDLEESYEFDQLTLEQKTAQAAKIEAIDESTAAKSMASAKKAQDATIKGFEKETEAKKKEAQIQALVDAAKVEAISNIFRQSAGLAKEGTALAKILGIASATVDTYKAANLALATYPPPFGQIAAGVNVAVGLGNVAKISGVKFARGGISGGVLSGPSHAHGGIPFSVGGRLGFEAEGGEAIINKRSTAMYKPLLSRINQSGGGVPFAVGGITGDQTRLAATSAQSEFDLVQMSRLINDVKIVLVREDFEVKQNQHNEIQQRAQVI